MSTRAQCSVHTYRANVTLSKQTVEEKKNRMCIIMDVLSLKVIARNLLAAVSVLNVNPRKLNQRKSLTALY